MCVWIIPPVAGLIEPVPAPEFVVSRCGAVERIGDFVRFYLYSERLQIEDAGAPPVRAIEVKIVRPLDGLHFIGNHLIMSDGAAGLVPNPQPFGGRGPRLVT